TCPRRMLIHLQHKQGLSCQDFSNMAQSKGIGPAAEKGSENREHPRILCYRTGDLNQVVLVFPRNRPVGAFVSQRVKVAGNGADTQPVKEAAEVHVKERIGSVIWLTQY